MTVRVEVLGPLQVQVDGANTPIGGPKARAVLAALAARAGQACSVDELAEEVWGESPPSNARNSLQSHVSRLRTVLASPERIRFSEDRYTLDVSVHELDAHAVEAGLERVRGSAARSDWATVADEASALLELWRGRAFAGFEDVPSARNWAARLEESRIVLAELFVDGLLGQSRTEEALIELSSLTDEHPWREGLATRQALSLYRAGRQTEALQALQDFRAALVDATGLDPTTAISDLETAILTHDPALDPRTLTEPPVAPFPADLERLAAMPMFGRDAEQERIDASLEDFTTKPCRLLTLVGEAGVGKSRLAAQVAAGAFATGIPVLYGRCTERLDLAYQPFVQALRQFEPAIIESIEPTVQVDTNRNDEAELRQQNLFSAFAETLARLAEDRGAVLVIDDVQWASASTIALLEHLVSVSRPSGIAIVATMRDSEDSTTDLAQLLRDIERRGDGQTTALSGLSSASVRLLLDASQLSAEDGEVASLVRSTAGNPLLLTELARAAIQAGSNSIDVDAASGDDLPSAIANIVQDRIGRLNYSLDILETAATIGVEFELPVLAKALGSTVDVLPALEEATMAKLVTEMGPGTWQFRHAITREVLIDSIGPSRHARYHQSVAEALAAIYGPDNAMHVGRRAHHLCRAAQPGSTSEAVQAAITAARARLDQLDSGEALQHVTDGLGAHALDPAADPAAEAELHLLAAHTHLHRFDHPSRLAAADKAEACARRCNSGRLLAEAALIRTAFWTQGTLDDHTVPLLLEALHALGDTEPELRSELLTNLSGWASVAGAAMTNAVRDALPGDAIELAERAAELAREANSTTCEVAALGALFVGKWCGPFCQEQLTIADQIENVDDPSASVMAQRWRLDPLLATGQREAFRRNTEKLLVDATEIRSRHLQAFAMQCQAAEALLEARFDDANRLGAAAVERARSHPNFDLVYQAQVFWIAYERNELSLILPFVAAAAAEHDPNLPSFQAMYAVSLARCGQIEAAHQLLDELGRQQFDDLGVDILWVATMMGIADAVAELGAAKHAPALRRHLAPYAGQLAVVAGGGFVYGAIDRVRAIMAALDGDLAEADELFVAAIEAEDQLDAPALSLRTRYWRTRVLGTKADDPQTLRRAAEALGLIGLVHDLDQLSAQIG